jgi:hypothetical protein
MCTATGCQPNFSWQIYQEYIKPYKLTCFVFIVICFSYFVGVWGKRLICKSFLSVYSKFLIWFRAFRHLYFKTKTGEPGRCNNEVTGWKKTKPHSNLSRWLIWGGICFHKAFRPGPGPTKPPVKCVWRNFPWIKGSGMWNHSEPSSAENVRCCNAHNALLFRNKYMRHGLAITTQIFKNHFHASHFRYSSLLPTQKYACDDCTENKG